MDLPHVLLSYIWSTTLCHLGLQRSLLDSKIITYTTVKAMRLCQEQLHFQASASESLHCILFSSPCAQFLPPVNGGRCLGYWRHVLQQQPSRANPTGCTLAPASSQCISSEPGLFQRLSRPNVRRSFSSVGLRHPELRLVTEGFQPSSCQHTSPGRAMGCLRTHRILVLELKAFLVND